MSIRVYVRTKSKWSILYCRSRKRLSFTGRMILRKCSRSLSPCCGLRLWQLARLGDCSQYERCFLLTYLIISRTWEGPYRIARLRRWRRTSTWLVTPLCFPLVRAVLVFRTLHSEPAATHHSTSFLLLLFKRLLPHVKPLHLSSSPFHY